MDCDGFLDEEGADHEHYCVLHENHMDDHECDCGVTWKHAKTVGK